MIDVLLLAIFGIVTWCVASEGAWGAALLCLCVVFSGLLAMNFFEPLAAGLAGTGLGQRADIIALVGLFAGCVFGLRYVTEHLLPSYIQVHALLFEGVRWGAGALTGYVTMAFLLTALHTAPLPREFLGFQAERDNLFGMAAPDRQWLGFTQHVSEHAFAGGGSRIFDGPQFPVGSYPGDTVWPSFPIRYATRRGSPSAGAATTPGGGGGFQRRTPAAGSGVDF